MKRLIPLILILFFTQTLLAQEEKGDTASLWKTGGVTSINFSQVSFKNWASGGENSFSLNGMLNLHANYKNERFSWDNSLNIGYGVIKQGQRGVRKSDDKFEVSSKFGYKSSSDWYYSGSFSFRTQFDKGFKYNDEKGTKTQLSGFMAPAYMFLSLGMDYKPSDHFTMLISPVTGKSTFMLDDSLSAKGAFGVSPGKKIRNEFGGYIKIAFNQEIWDNVTLESKLDLFSNYIEEPQNIDINWEVLITMKVNEYLSANFSSQLIYDDNIKYVDKSGEEHGPRIQFKEVFGAGLSFKF